MIKLQDGPRWARGKFTVMPDAMFDEEVIEEVIAHLNLFQTTDFECRQHANAIEKLEEALHWLASRSQHEAPSPFLTRGPTP